MIAAFLDVSVLFELPSAFQRRQHRGVLVWLTRLSFSLSEGNSNDEEADDDNDDDDNDDTPPPPPLWRLCCVSDTLLYFSEEYSDDDGDDDDDDNDDIFPTETDMLLTLFVGLLLIGSIGSQRLRG